MTLICKYVVCQRRKLENFELNFEVGTGKAQLVNEI